VVWGLGFWFGVLGLGFRVWDLGMPEQAFPALDGLVVACERGELPGQDFGKTAHFLPRPGVALRANVESTFRKCYLIQVAFLRVSAFGRCHLPSCCLQGGFPARPPTPSPIEEHGGGSTQRKYC